MGNLARTKKRALAARTPGLLAAASGKLVANWPVAMVRHFGIDPLLGDDGNVGYVDAAVSAVDVDGLRSRCVKSETRLWEIVPKHGAGRMAVVHFANHSHADGALVGDVDLSGFAGYSYFLARAWTAWLAGPGSECWGALDCRISGARRAMAGPNADGSFTVATASTTATLALTVAAGGAAFANDGATLFRVRFKGNVTPGIADKCCCVYKSTMDTLEMFTPAIDEAWANTTPVAGDEFWIERPGVLPTSYREAIFNAGAVAATNASGDKVAASGAVGFGIRGSTGAASLGGAGRTRYCFCETVSADNLVAKPNARNVHLLFSDSFYRPDGTPCAPRAGVRLVGSASFNFVGSLEMDFGSGCLKAPTDLNHGVCSVLADYAYLRSGVFLGGITIDAPLLFIGTNTSSEAWMRKVRVARVLETVSNAFSAPNASVYISGLFLDNGVLKLGSAAAPRTGAIVRIENLSGGPVSGCVKTTPIYARNTSLAVITLGENVVATGAGGDITLTDGSILAFSSLTVQEHIDATGTRWIGPVGVGAFRAVGNGSVVLAGVTFTAAQITALKALVP